MYIYTRKLVRALTSKVFDLGGAEEASGVDVCGSERYGKVRLGVWQQVADEQRWDDGNGGSLVGLWHCALTVWLWWNLQSSRFAALGETEGSVGSNFLAFVEVEDERWDSGNGGRPGP